MAQNYSTGAGNLGYDNLVYRDSVSDVTGATPGPSSTGNPGANKLWLPLWSGEVINAYDQYNMFENLINTKTISGGFAYEFPITGTVALNASWDAGEELIGGDSSSTTFKVILDKRPMAAHFETDNIDLLVTQWDYRSELARQAGLTLANTRDKQVAVALTAACAVGQISTDPRGLAAAAFQAPASISTNILASGCTEAEALKVLQEIENYLVTCQENDIAVTDVYCVVRPKVFQVIRALGIPRAMAATGTNANSGANQSYGMFFGGGDDWKAGAPLNVGMNLMTDTLEYMGVKIMKSNHLPGADLSATTASIGSSKYNLNCGVTAYGGTGNAAAAGLQDKFSIYGIIFQTQAIAGLSLQGMKVDTVQDVRRNTQFTVASMMKGTGIIRPETCRALVSSTVAAASVTRALLAEHLDKSATSGTAGSSNFTNGFGAEYTVTS
jgi:hypothetical protein